MYSIQDFEIIDAHIHPFIDPAGSIAPYGHPSTTSELFAELIGLGIKKACGSVIIRHHVDFREMQRANRDALYLRDRYPDFYIPGVHIHGDYPAESIRELERLYSEDVRWIGEIVPYIMGTGEYSDAGMMEIYAAVQEMGMVINMHSGEPLEQIDEITRRFPELKIVLAHPGDMGSARERFRFVAEHRNVHMDISGTGLFRWNMLRYAVDTAGAEKFLFGSDFPVCSSGMNLYGALAEHLTKEEFQMLFSANFRRLTGL